MKINYPTIIMTSCNAPINLVTSSPSIKLSKESLVCNYYAGNCTSTNKASNITFEYDITDLPSNIKYKGTTYVLKSCKLYKPSIHKIDGKSSVAELVLWHQHISTNANLLICIPVKIDVTGTSSFGTLITQPKVAVPNFDSPKKFIPTGGFYSYKARNFTNCSNSDLVEYIVFSSSSVSITQTELKMIPASSFPVVSDSDVVVYKHTRQTTNKPTITFNDDNVFIDCQPIDAPEGEAAGPSMVSATQSTPSINFSRLKHNKFIQMLLVFIIFMVVMVIFFYSYEFTTGMFRELTKSLRENTVPSQLNK